MNSSPISGDTEITFTVNATIPGMTNPLTRSVTITTESALLIAVIKGGEYVTTGSSSDPFHLDCSRSRDPNYAGDGSDPGLSFSWSCHQVSLSVRLKA